MTEHKCQWCSSEYECMNPRCLEPYTAFGFCSDKCCIDFNDAHNRSKYIK